MLMQRNIRKRQKLKKKYHFPI